MLHKFRFTIMILAIKFLDCSNFLISLPGGIWRNMEESPNQRILDGEESIKKKKKKDYETLKRGEKKKKKFENEFWNNVEEYRKRFINMEGG